MLLSIPKPFDGHAHLRDGALLRAVLPYTASQFGRAIVMPNLKPPVTTAERARTYRNEILDVLGPQGGFEPLMTLYLTDDTDADDLERGFRDGVLTAAKLYPANATTNASEGVTGMRAVYPVLERMQRLGMPLSMHGEVNDPDVDIFDREAVFVDRVLVPLRRDFPALRMVLEHLSSRHAVSYVLSEEASGTLGGTITAHHLRINRNHMLSGGFNPHYYCMPIVKTEDDRRALAAAATSGRPVIFAGTDSAPHPRAMKEKTGAASGCFTHINAVELYAGVFDDAGALDRLPAFLGLNGPVFYGLKPGAAVLELEKLDAPASDLKPILTGDGAEIVPFQDAAPVMWRVRDNRRM